MKNSMLQYLDKFLKAMSSNYNRAKVNGCIMFYYKKVKIFSLRTLNQNHYEIEFYNPQLMTIRVMSMEELIYYMQLWREVMHEIRHVNKGYIKGASFPANEILPLIGTAKHMILGGKKVKVSGYRLELYAQKGVTCVECGLQGQYFTVESNDCGSTYHLNLYGIDASGKERMMTFDHVLPKSLGGKNHVDNGQVMCKCCNEKKGNKIDVEIVECC